MKNMRELINLMEGVMSVPGISPSTVGNTESDMQTSGTVGRDQAYGEFDSAQGQATEEGIELGNNEDGAAYWYIVDDTGMILSNPYDSGPEAQSDAKYKQWFNPSQHSIEHGVDDGSGYIVSATISEKSTSDKQARFMAACAHGADYRSCPPDKISKEFNKADRNSKQLSNAMKTEGFRGGLAGGVIGATITKSPGGAMTGANIGSDLENWLTGKDDVEEDEASSSVDPVNIIKSAISQAHPGDTSPEAIAAEVPHLANDPQFASWHAQAHDSFYGLDSDEDLTEPGHGYDEDDFTDYRMRQGEMGMEESFDLSNGYGTEKSADGNDYFPNGADGPVVSKVGPSGARQGDNPEQKKMQVAETHKELVYAYRSFLKESAK